MGGRVDAMVAITIGGQTTQQGATFYVDGLTIPPSIIDGQLQSEFATAMATVGSSHQPSRIC
jgi:hypothetical protein